MRGEQPDKTQLAQEQTASLRVASSTDSYWPRGSILNRRFWSFRPRGSGAHLYALGSVWAKICCFRPHSGCDLPTDGGCHLDAT
jgi:hypothetical protein